LRRWVLARRRRRQSLDLRVAAVAARTGGALYRLAARADLSRRTATRAAAATALWRRRAPLRALRYWRREAAQRSAYAAVADRSWAQAARGAALRRWQVGLYTILPSPILYG